MGISIGTIIGVASKVLPLLQQGAAVAQEASEAASAILALGDEARQVFAGDPDLAELEATLARIQAANDAGFARLDAKLADAEDDG